MARVRRLAEPGALATSALLHAGLIALGAWLLHASMKPSSVEPADAARTVEVSVEGSAVELPEMSTHGTSGPSDPNAEREQQPVGGTLGGERMARPDIPEPGRGGTDESAEPALNLADSRDGLSLDRDPINRLDRSQLQRVKTGQLRESWDDRRATPNPMELSFLASGKGTLAIRRPPAETDPSRGLSTGGVLEREGGLVGSGATEAGVGDEPEAGAARSGSGRDVGALGVASGDVGRDFRRSARVMLARPMVTRSRAAVPAPEKGRPSDTVDSSQDVASAVASLIHASTAGGRRGTGIGGQRGPGLPASGGGQGAGSRSAAAGSGAGALLDVGADAGVLGYFRAVERKVDWSEAFPRWAIAEGRGGLAVAELVIRRDGALLSVKLSRVSGIPEFDANLLAAIRRAAPFAPLPRALQPGPQTLRMTFDATNPAVGREGPGRGQKRAP